MSTQVEMALMEVGMVGDWVVEAPSSSIHFLWTQSLLSNMYISFNVGGKNQAEMTPFLFSTSRPIRFGSRFTKLMGLKGQRCLIDILIVHKYCDSSSLLLADIVRFHSLRIAIRLMVLKYVC